MIRWIRHVRNGRYKLLIEMSTKTNVLGKDNLSYFTGCLLPHTSTSTGAWLITKLKRQVIRQDNCIISEVNINKVLSHTLLRMLPEYLASSFPPYVIGVSRAQ
jgi:hypothetical protein